MQKTKQLARLAVRVYCDLIGHTQVDGFTSIVRLKIHAYAALLALNTRVGLKYSTCTWYLYLSTYLSVLDVLEYLVYGNAKVLVLVLVLDQKVLGTYK